MKQHTDRWKAIEDHVLPLLPLALRMEAVNGKDAMREHKEYVSIATRDRLEAGRPKWDEDPIDSVSTVGCLLSHINAWKTMVQENIPLMLVCEDDVDVRACDMAAIHAAFQDGRTTLQNTSVWFLDHASKRWQVEQGRWMVQYDRGSAMAYIVTLPAAQALLQHALPIELPVDKHIAFMCRLGFVHAVVHPDVRMRGNFRSSFIDHPLPKSVQYRRISIAFSTIMGIMLVVIVVMAVLLQQCRHIY